MKKTLLSITLVLVLTSCGQKEKILLETISTEPTESETSSEQTIPTEIMPVGSIGSTSNGGVKTSISIPKCEDVDCEPQVDTESFESLGYNYSKDKNYVYYGHEDYQILEGLDTNSIEIVGNFIKDKNGVYFVWIGETLNLVTLDADPNSFEVIASFYVKDEHSVFSHPEFYDGKLTVRIDGADPTTFEILQGDISRDASHIFIDKQMLGDADVTTFAISDKGIFYDKNGVYLSLGKSFVKFTEIDAKTFEEIDNLVMVLTGKDKNNFYEFRLSQWKENEGRDFVKLNTFKYDQSPSIAVNNIALEGIIDADRYDLLSRVDVATMASRLIMGIQEYNSASLPWTTLKGTLDLLYTDVPPDESWNKEILKAMYLLNENGIMMGDSNTAPTTFRPTEGINTMEFVKVIYDVLKAKGILAGELAEDFTSSEDLLETLKTSGLISNYNLGDNGFLEFPFYYGDSMDSYVNYRLDFQQPILVEDAYVFLYMLIRNGYIE